MVKQNILLLQHIKKILALGDFGNAFRQAGCENRKLQLWPRHQVRHIHHPHQIHRPVDAVDVDFIQLELRGEKLQGFLGAVVGNFQSHRIAQMTLRQFTL